MSKNKKIVGLLVASMLAFAACTPAAPAPTPPAPAPAPAAGAPADAPADAVTEPTVDFPTRAINMTVAFGAGGGTDLAARAFQAVAPEFFNGQSFVVNNVTGGGGATWYSQGHLQNADGYEVTIATVEIVTLPLLQDVPFATEDYTYIAKMNVPAAAISVHSDSPWYTLEDFLEAAAARPGEIRVGNSGVNGIWDLHTHALAQAAGVTFNHIPYEGAAPAVVALMAGEIEAVAVSAAEVSTQVLDGTFRLLSVAAAERLPSFPDVPTHGEFGLEVPFIGGWRGLAVPANTPPEIVAEFERRATEVINSQEFIDIMTQQDLTVNFLNSADFTAYVREQQEFFSVMIEELGLR